MTEIASLGLSISSDGVVVATDRLDKFSGAGKRAEDITGSLVRMATKAGAALAGAFSIRAIAAYADEWSDLQSQVGAAIKDMDAAGALMGRLGNIARASYSPLEQTVTAYARNAGVLRDLGHGAGATADYVESLNNALVITATRGDRAASVQNALAKAMATGKLQADGLETVLANGGRVAEALAAELGTNVSGLRAMASQSKITGEVIANALIKRQEELRNEAAKMPATLADAGTIWRNTLLEIIGRMDQAANSSGSLAEKLIEMADAVRAGAEGFIQFAIVVSENFERMVYWGGAYVTMMGVNYVASVGLATVATTAMSAALAGLRIAIAGTGLGALAIILGDVALKLWDSATATDGLAKSIGDTGKAANGFFTFMWNGAEALAVTFEWLTTGIAAGFMGAFATIYENYANLINLIRAGFRAIGIADMIGMSEGGDMDPKWATGVYNSLSRDAASAGRLAAEKWAVAFGKQLDMDTGSFPTMGEIKRLFGIADVVDPVKPPSLPDAPGGKSRKAYDDLKKGALEFIATQTLEQQALTLTGAAAAGLRYEQELLNKAANDNIALSQPQRDELAALAEAMAQAEQATEGVRFAIGDPDPWQQAITNIQNVDAALAAGALSWEQYGAAAFKANAGAASAVLGLASGMTGALAQMFQDNKAFAVANAVVSTAEAVMKAMATYGPTPWGFAAAGVAAATGVAQIASILSAQKGSSSVSRPSGSAPAQSQAQASAQRAVQLNVTLGGSGRYSRDEVRDLLEQLTDGLNDGVDQGNFKIAVNS